MIVSINSINTNLDTLDTVDSALIPSKDMVRVFGQPEDYVEAHIYSQDGNIISSDYNYKGYTIPPSLQGNVETLTTSLEFDPGYHLSSSGYSVGTFNVQYNILRKKIFDTNLPLFFINQISSDRTEIRITSNNISSADIETGVTNFLLEYQSSPYFKVFNLNFGSNNMINAINIALDKNTSPYSILVKLYNPLPSEFDLKSTLWFVEELSYSIVYQVEIAPDIIPVAPKYLRGANFDIKSHHKNFKPSSYINETGLLSNSSLLSYQKLLNKLSNKSIELNIDFSNYNNFIHFSSAKERLLNFQYKMQLIEGYQSDLSSLQNVPNYSSSYNVSQSAYTIQNNINTLISNFDGYETYLYYNSSSYSWPKSNSIKPYINYSYSSSQVISWLGSDYFESSLYGGQIYSASYYDKENQNNLVYTIPEYILLDDNSAGYELFVQMIGQSFDNIWVYINAISELYHSNNSLTSGISKDLVYYALSSLGINLYNSRSNDDLYSYFLGQTTSGSYLPVTSSYETLISSSQYSITGQDIYKEQLKRIYHNLSFLLKSKGTSKGLQALISSFGIPDSILDIKEYGGSDKSSMTSEYIYDRYSEALVLNGSQSVVIPWGALNQNYIKYASSSINPDTIEFRFKLPSSGYKTSASLMDVVDNNGNKLFGVTYNNISSSSPYANINFYITGSNTISASVPLFYTQSNGDSIWWNVYLGRTIKASSGQNTISQSYSLIVKDKIIPRIGHVGFVTMSTANSSSNNAWNSISTSASLCLGGYSGSFIGEVQEFRYWSEPLNSSSFDFHVLNPMSVEGNMSSSAVNDLAARFSLGNDLLTYDHSIVKNVSSVHNDFKNPIFYKSGSNQSASFYGFGSGNSYIGFVDTIVTDIPNSLYTSPVNQKVRISNNYITGSVLSPTLRLEAPDVYTTRDLHFLDVSFSPQNEIDKDIISQYGSTIDIDQYIGDPSYDYSGSYSTLDTLKNSYFSKYIKGYNYKDYIRLVEFFDNSLFKMIEDFAPARSNVFTGITIKSPILERNKVKRTKTILKIINPSSGSISIGEISADSIYSSSYQDGSDFYNGNLSGSIFDYGSKFVKRNTSPFAIFTTGSNVNNFNHSIFNTTYGHVNDNRQSLIYKKVDNNNHHILSTSSIQDSNYSLQRHIRPRYLGSKSTSATYTIYTSGDQSYGKNAAIDVLTERFAWINQVAVNILDFIDKTKLNIKYLVDISGSTTELNRYNRNLFNVQNIYKNDTNATVALLDPYNPTTQITLEGSKKIWKSGVNYTPILFREDSEPLYYDYLTPLHTFQYPMITASQQNKWSYKTILPNNTAMQNNRYIDLDISTTIPQGYTLTYGNNPLTAGAFSLPRISPFSSWAYASYIPALTTVYITGPGFNEYFSGTYESDADQFVYKINPEYFNFSDQVSTNDPQSQYIELSDGSYAYVVPRASSYVVNGYVPFNYSVDDGVGGPNIIQPVLLFESSSDGGNTWAYVGSSTISHVEYGSLGSQGVNTSLSVVALDNNRTVTSFNGGNDTPIKVMCHVNNVNANFNYGDYVRASFYIIRRNHFIDTGGVNNARISFENLFSNSNIANLGAGFIEIQDIVNSDEIYVPMTGSVYTDESFFTLSGSNGLSLTQDASASLWNVAIFNPQEPEKGLYSDVVYPFNIEVGDLIRLDSFYFYNAILYTVVSVDTGSAGHVNIGLDQPVSTTALTAGLSARFAVFKKQDDETNVYIYFQKVNGKTSSGLLIPWNLDNEVRDNISNIIGPLKSKLLSTVLTIT